MLANIGAYIASDRQLLTPFGMIGTVVGVYRIPAAYAAIHAVLSNTSPTAPYRGAGRPEASYLIERVMEAAADELGIDPIELRRRNMIPTDALPYQTPLGPNYDVGDFAKNLAMALDAADYDGFAARREEATQRGKLRGIGVANAIEQAAGPVPEYAEIRFNPSGTALLLLGTKTHGQGHDTAFKQILHSTDRHRPGGRAVRRRRHRYRRLRHGLQRLALDGDGRLRRGEGGGEDRRQGKEDRGASARSRRGRSRPGRRQIHGGRHRPQHHVEGRRQGRVPAGAAAAGHRAGALRERDLSAVARHLPQFLPCRRSRDRSRHRPVDLVSYLVVDDVGTVINPLTLKGQIHGGVAQGAGQILMEQVAYEPGSGQLLSGSFMDYAMPRADTLPDMTVISNPVPTPSNPLGAKGAGEAGTVGAMPAVMIAVMNALKPLGVRELDMPATSDRVWHAIQEAPSAPR